jgi:hypothetical protein
MVNNRKERRDSAVLEHRQSNQQSSTDYCTDRRKGSRILGYESGEWLAAEEPSVGAEIGKRQQVLSLGSSYDATWHPQCPLDRHG